MEGTFNKSHDWNKNGGGGVGEEVRRAIATSFMTTNFLPCTFKPDLTMKT